MSRATVNGTLSVGFLAVATATVIARANPATTYEPSVYTGTPMSTWIGFALALSIAVSAVLTCRGRQQAIGIGLGGLTVTAIVSLPVIRNYYFAGMGDGLSHLGWTRDIVTGKMAAHELFYPGVHAIGSIFHILGGVSIERGLLFTIVVLFIPFLVFVPLVTRDLSGNELAVGIAAIVSWMVLPINNVATHMGVHTNSNALFLVPVVIFALVAYLRRTTIERLPFGLSPFSILIYVSGIALLLVHPQQMANVVIFFAAVSGVQFLARRRYDDHPMVEHPTAYTSTIILGIIFAVWAVGNKRFRDALVGLVYGLLTKDVGAGAEVGQRGGSLTEIGGSLTELFVTMFLEAALIGLIVGLFVLLTWLGRTKLTQEAWSFITYFGIALIPLGGLFVVYFVGTPTMAFRQLGFLYVILTILAGIALAHGVGRLSGVISTPGANAITSVFLSACLVLGLMTVYASPIIYKPGQHITEETFSGYESGLEHGADGVPYVGMGYDPYRYDHGINGLGGSETLTAGTASSGEANAAEFNEGDYDNAYRGIDYYFVVTEWDKTRELGVYRELHYDQTALKGMKYDSHVNKVISNNDFRMYAVSSGE